MTQDFSTFADWLKEYHPMGTPTKDDPLGQKPDANDLFVAGVRDIIASEIRRQWQGRASATMEGIPNEVLAMELIARGWIAYKPSQPK